MELSVVNPEINPMGMDQNAPTGEAPVNQELTYANVIAGCETIAMTTS